MDDERDIESMMAQVEETVALCDGSADAINTSRVKRGAAPIDWLGVENPKLDKNSPVAKAPTEATVLGAIMILGQKKIPAEVHELGVECFTQQPYAYVWSMIEDCLAEGLDCDEVTVWDRIAKDADRPAGIESNFHCLTAICPSVVNLDRWVAGLVAEAEGKRQQLQLENIMGNKDLDAETKAAEVQRLLMGVKPKSGSIRRVKDLLPTWLNDFQAEQVDPEHGIVAKTGIPSIDHKTKLKAGEMTIIAGRPGMGKSALAGNIAAYCAVRAGGDVALFSLEMTASAVITRLVTASARINLGGKILDHQWGRIIESADGISSMSLWVDERSSLDVSDMRSALMRVPNTKLIVVDYLGLLNEDKRAPRHDLAVGWNVKEVRALAKDFGAHAIVLCQLNRKVEERKPPIPQLSDLRDSGNIEEHADNVWFVYRPGYYDSKTPDNEATIIVDKQRHGEKSRVEIGWDGATQRFFDVDTQHTDEPPQRPLFLVPSAKSDAHDWKQAAAGRDD